MTERLAAISVDIDEIPCYTAIHGLVPPDASAAHAIYRRALPRLAELFARESIPATFFVIGKDLEHAENVETLKALRDAGHELSNHSLNHIYDLSRQDRDTIRREIEGGMDVIEAATGVRPRGFRAPGYTIVDTVFEVLQELGVEYDSSVFPCPAYYGAKTAAIGAIRIRGRRSHSIVDDPRVLSAPADPYRVGTPYWSRGDGVLELPIGVTRRLTGQLPYIGTSVTMAGEKGARWLTKMIAGRPLVCLELHGIDLADREEDGLEFLAPHQPDLRRSAAQKERALCSAIDALREAGYRFVTMAEAAEHFARA